MDTASLVASEAHYNEQGETIDDWLVGSEFETANQIPDPSAVQVSHSGPPSGIGLFDPEHLLSADMFPDINDFSPRGVDDRTHRDKEKVSPLQDAPVPPELISLGNAPFDGLPSLQIEPVSNHSISVAPMTIQGLRDDPVSSPGPEIHAVANQSSQAGPAGSQELEVESNVGHQGGLEPAVADGLRIESAAYPVLTGLTADCSPSIQDVTSRPAQVAPDSQQGLHIARPGDNITRMKRVRNTVNDDAQMQTTDMANELARVASLPPKPSKRRHGGRAASSVAPTNKAGTEGGEANGHGSGCADTKGPPNKRPATARARPGGMAGSLTAEERRKIRAERNRESAEKSRLRHKQRTLELEQNVLRLRTENRELKARVDTFRIQLQSASQNLSTGKGNFAGDSVVADQVPALKSALAAIEEVMNDCPRTFGPESKFPEIALSVKGTR